MKVKIINVNSEHGKKFIGIQGILIIDYEGDRRLHIQKDDDGRYLNTTEIEKITVQTKNSTYEMKVI